MNIDEKLKLALKKKDETSLLDVLFSVTKQELKAACETDKWIFCRICELGFSSSVQYLLESQLGNVNDTYDNWTPLQYACKAGHSEIVKHLLKWDAEVKQDVWREDSEFFLVSVHGNFDTAKTLYATYKDLVEDTDICYTLLCAACQGGHLPLVHMWFKPGHNINQVAPFVPNLDQCEYRYPLFAACQGGHLDVAKSLIKDLGAELTREISEYFVDFTAKLVKDLCLVSTSKGEFMFGLTKINVDYLLPQWFHLEQPEDHDDECDDFREIVILSVGNSLQQLSADILWHLHGLVQLDVSKNPFLKIEEPLSPSELGSNRLVSLDVSHCELESISSYVFMLPCLEDLNLSHNKLTQLGHSVDQCTAGQSDGVKWMCKRLKFLNISHNSLSSLPCELHGCPNIDSLIANNNQLTSLCPPWTCSLSNLNVSHNLLSYFPTSAENFWRNSLKHLFIQHNQLDQLPVTIVALDSLRHLNASHNRIAKIPDGERWRCRLFYLNLSHNELGIGVRKASLSRVMSIRNDSVMANISFIGTSILRSLNELFLQSNSLKCVPDGVADMSNLSILDLGNNPALISLPCELGRLQKLLILGLKGICVEDKELQTLIKDLNDEERHVSARDIIMYLERKRRGCLPSSVLKMVVLRTEKKQTLTQQLASRKIKSQATPVVHHEEMFVTEIPLGKTSDHVAVVWEFPDMKFTLSLLPCFLTLNTLYLLQMEVDLKTTSVTDICLKKLTEQMASIQACVLRPEILVVLTFPRGTSKSDILSVEKELTQRQRLRQFEFSGIKFFPLVDGRPQNLDGLWDKVEDIFNSMADTQFDKNRSLVQRSVPESFLQVYNKVICARQEQNLQLCTLDKFLEITDCSYKDLKDCMEPEYTLEEFLLQNGAILHYSNFNKDLSNCVFLDPAWLFQILTKFVKSLNSNIPRLPEAKVMMKMQELLPTDGDYSPALLALLELFNIGFRIVDSRNTNILVIPSLLHKDPPHSELPEYRDGLKAARLYCLPALPDSLWSHLISQLIMAFHRFSQSHWKFGISDRGSSRPGSDVKNISGVEHHKSFKINRHMSMHGLKLSDKNIQFWRTGILIFHDQGYMVVEQVECSDKGGQKTPGILVTVQTNDSSTEKENLRKLAAIGIIRDELEDVLEMFIPKFSDPSALELKPFALCRHCRNITPLSGHVNTDGIHFTVRDCAQVMLRKDNIVCEKGPSSLQELVPELFFLELPEAMRLEFKDLKLKTDEKLGRGIAGEVLKGYFKEQEVAVKVFHHHQGHENKVERVETHNGGRKDDVHYTNCHPPSLAEELSQQSEDRLESEQRKISNAFSEVRREVGILSKLQHQCIVNFIGVCVQPHLLLVMELAPLGSLRSELERQLALMINEKRDSAALSTNNNIISKMVFSKNLTYKMILQIASGLSHLHSHQIIFRDLKPDNILLMSLEESATINVKLSDYGISKFATLQGISGLYGTIGYIAPEVLTKQQYTQKVDIFSLGIVMGEILTGIPPVDPDKPARLSDVANDGTSPGHMQGYEVQCNFPCLEELMKECWSPHSECRPHAEDIVKRMKAERFLLMHDSAWLDEGPGLEVTCVYTCETSGRWMLWICESGSSNRRFISVYDIGANCFTVKRAETTKGPAVTAMLKVGARVLLACQDEQMLYTLSRGSGKMFKISPEVCLDGIPTKLINFKFGKTQEKYELVLAGLQDGPVTSVCRSVCGKTSTISKVELQVDQNSEGDNEKQNSDLRERDQCSRINIRHPVASLCQVGTRCVVVASGEDIHTLQVNGDGVCPAGTLNMVSYGSKISLKSLAQDFVPISCIASQTKQAESDAQIVWCCMETEPLLVQVDLAASQVILVLRVSWNQGQDTMRLERNSSPWPLFRSHAFSDSCIEKSDTSDEVCNEMENVIPSLPLRKPVTGKSFNCSQSSPDKAEHPPPIPPRQTRIEIYTKLHCLTVSGNVLMIGTNCGGLFAIPLASIDSPNGTVRGGGLPLHMGVFWHQRRVLPAVQAEARLRQRRGSNSSSYSSTSFFPVNTPPCVQIPEGEISLILQAGTRMISIYTSQEKVMRRLRTGSGVSTSSKKRSGLLLTPELNPEQWVLEDNEIEDVSIPGVSCRSEPSESISDIAVWDYISSDRLASIGNFGFDLN